MRAPVRGAVFWLGWWIASMLLWLALTSTLKASEAIVGMGASAIAATAAEIVRINLPRKIRVRVRWLRHAWRLPYHIVSDTITVFSRLGRSVVTQAQPRGSFEWLEMRHDGEKALDGGRHLIATMGISVSPNTYVVGFDERT